MCANVTVYLFNLPTQSFSLFQKLHLLLHQCLELSTNTKLIRHSIKTKLNVISIFCLLETCVEDALPQKNPYWLLHIAGRDFQ